MAKPKFIRCMGREDVTHLVNVNHIAYFKLIKLSEVYYLYAVLADESEHIVDKYDSEEKAETVIRHIRLGTFNLI